MKRHSLVSFFVCAWLVMTATHLPARVVFQASFTPFDGRDTLIVSTGFRAFLTKGSELAAIGFRLHDFEQYKEHGHIRYVSVWRIGSGANTVKRFSSLNRLIAFNNQQAKAGRALTDLEVVSAGATRSFIAVWRIGGPCEITSHRGLPSLESEMIERNADGWKLVKFAQGFTGKRRQIIAVWRKLPGNYSLHHHRSFLEFVFAARRMSRHGERLLNFEHVPNGIMSIWKTADARLRILKYEGMPNLLQGKAQKKESGFAIDDLEVRVFPDKNSSPGSSFPPGETPDCDVLPQVPSYIKLVNDNRIVVDFRLVNRDPVTDLPTVSIPQNLLFDVLPVCPNGDLVFPTNFCGFRITHVDDAIWQDAHGEELGNVKNDFHPVYSSMHNMSELHQDLYLNGLSFCGPMGACMQKPNFPWAFIDGLTKTGGLDPNNTEVVLILEIDPDASISFIQGTELPPLNEQEYWNDGEKHLMVQLAEQFELFEELRAWLDALCEEDWQQCIFD